MKRRLGCALAALIAVAVGPNSADSATNFSFKLVLPSLAPYGYVKAANKWSVKDVPVCWDNPEAASPAAMASVKSAVEATWSSASGFIATGWGKCGSDTAKGVHLFWIDDADGPRALIGTALDGSRHGVRLNPTFKSWGSAYCRQNVDVCVRSIAIHEFGHVLGLMHESLRDDAPPDCRMSAAVLRDDSVPTGGVTLRTPYDDKSVMNYCNNIYGRALRLSDGDQKVAAILFGPARM